jgi:hypothetical protein
VAADTLALTAPKKTILLDDVVLKLVPVIVTVDPTGPEVGVNELIVGWENKCKEEKTIPRQARQFFFEFIFKR